MKSRPHYFEPRFTDLSGLYRGVRRGSLVRVYIPYLGEVVGVDVTTGENGERIETYAIKYLAAESIVEDLHHAPRHRLEPVDSGTRERILGRPTLRPDPPFDPDTGAPVELEHRRTPMERLLSEWALSSGTAGEILGMAPARLFRLMRTRYLTAEEAIAVALAFDIDVALDAVEERARPTFFDTLAEARAYYIDHAEDFINTGIPPTEFHMPSILGAAEDAGQRIEDELERNAYLEKSLKWLGEK